MWQIWHILTKHPTVLAVLAAGAEASTIVADRWSPLINLGAVGCILAWFLIKLEPRMRRIEQAIDRASRAQMLAVMSMHGIPANIREQAEGLKQEIEAADERRKGG